jgi:hypothetical protein
MPERQFLRDHATIETPTTCVRSMPSAASRPGIVGHAADGVGPVGFALRPVPRLSNTIVR